MEQAHSRDWAAKSTKLLGIKAVIVESFERIHRSNLIGMGVMPIQLDTEFNLKDLGLKGNEVVDINIDFERLKTSKHKKIEINIFDETGKIRLMEVFGTLGLIQLRSLIT